MSTDRSTVGELILRNIHGSGGGDSKRNRYWVLDGMKGAGQEHFVGIDKEAEPLTFD